MTTSTPSDYIDRIARQFNVRVYLGNAPNGIAEDWNFALRQATADIVTLAHQDDVYYPEFLSETLNLFTRTPNASLSFTDYEELDDIGEILPNGRVLLIKRLLRRGALGKRAIAGTRFQRRLLLAFGSTIPCPSVSINRKIVGDFQFSGDYQINLDWDAWWRLHALDHPFVLSHRALMGHRLHRAMETSRGKQDGRRAREDHRMFARIWPQRMARLLSALYRLGY